MPHCNECNSILIKDEIDICNACKKEACKPTSDDLERLKEVLEDLEMKTLHGTGILGISGGFAVAEYFDYDAKYFDVELKWGIQNDCENRVNIEQHKISRDTFEIE